MIGYAEQMENLQNMLKNPKQRGVLGEYFLETLRPTVSIISVGDNNDYGHPHPAVLFRLSEIFTEIYQTETGAGGLLPEAHILGDSIFIYVETNGGYTVNGDTYEPKRPDSN